MGPILSSDDKAHHPARNAKPVGNCLLGQAAGCEYPSDFQHVLLSEFYHSVTRPGRVGAVPTLIRLVLSVGYPAKVASSVIEAVTVPVRNFMPLGRAWAIKYGADHHVYVDARSCAKKDAGIAAGYKAMAQNNARLPTFPVSLVSDNTVQRPDTSQAGRFIPRMARYRAPFLDLCYRLFSHVALLQRGGQGMTEGSNQPSFPIYHMTVLCARV